MFTPARKGSIPPHYILDPKNADLADLGTVMENVYHSKDDMIDCVNAFYDGMVTRSEEMKLHQNMKFKWSRYHFFFAAF